MAALVLGSALLATSVAPALADTELKFDKTPDGATIAIGQEAKFTFVITNVGGEEASFPQLFDSLPGGGGVEWSSPTPDCTITGNPGSQFLECDFANLGPGEQATAEVSGFPTECAVLDNEAFVESDNAPEVSDTASITVECAPACDLTVEKSCAVASGPYICTKPITALTMKWNGTQAIRIAGMAGVTPFDMDEIQPGDVVTIDGYDGSQGNEVKWNICEALSGGPCDSNSVDFLGQSDFHLSCSDADMNTSDDCGKPEGDGKGNISCLPAGTCINDWILGGIAGPAGSPPLICPDVVDANAASCEVVPTPYTCSKPIQALTMTWQGGAGFPDPIYVGAQVTRGGATAQTGPISAGQMVTVGGYDGSLGNDVYWDIYGDAALTEKIGQSTFHLSCSDSDMNDPTDCGKTEGDGKGSRSCSPGPCVNLWTLQGIAGVGATLDCANPGGTGTVTYSYKVTNNGTAPVTFTLKDDVTTAGGTTTVDVFPGPDTVDPGTPKMYSMVDKVGETTTDVATAYPDPACGQTFASNPVTVTVPPAPPPQCPTSGEFKATDRDVKWKITAPSGENVELMSIMIGWPAANNGALREIKLGAPKIFKGSLVNSPQTITSFTGKTKDRTIEHGKTDELKFHFANKIDASPYSIEVTFTNGCKLDVTN
jgi:uncharacterized repeat protein (TIGR01451 family)